MTIFKQTHYINDNILKLIFDTDETFDDINQFKYLKNQTIIDIDFEQEDDDVEICLLLSNNILCRISGFIINDKTIFNDLLNKVIQEINVIQYDTINSQMKGIRKTIIQINYDNKIMNLECENIIDICHYEDTDFTDEPFIHFFSLDMINVITPLMFEINKLILKVESDSKCINDSDEKKLIFDNKKTIIDKLKECISKLEILNHE